LVNAAYEQRPELARQLKDLEHVADHTTHDIMPPVDSCEVGGRVIRIADGDNGSVDVGARASTASKIDFVRRPPRR
jgi:hypothetical protein